MFCTDSPFLVRYEAYSMFTLLSGYVSVFHPPGPAFESVHVLLGTNMFMLMKKTFTILIGCNSAQKYSFTQELSIHGSNQRLENEVCCVYPL